jgi:hypothetical protein
MVGALGAILTKNEKEEEEKGGKRQFPQLSITTKQRTSEQTNESLIEH